MLEKLKARLLTPLFRPFFLSTSVSTYRIDRPDQVEVLTNSFEIDILGIKDRLPLNSIKSISGGEGSRG